MVDMTDEVRMEIEAREVIKIIEEYSETFVNNAVTRLELVEEVSEKFKKVHEHVCDDKSVECETLFMYSHFLNLGASIAMNVVSREAEKEE